MKKTVQQSICKVGIGEREGRRRKPLDRSHTKGLFFSVNPWIWLLNPMDSVCMATPKDDGNSIESLICHQGRKSYSTIFCKALKNARFFKNLILNLTRNVSFNFCTLTFSLTYFFNSLIFWYFFVGYFSYWDGVHSFIVWNFWKVDAILCDPLGFLRDF